jgi:hypothetical protein
VEAALHRDQIEFDVRTAATPHDLLDGIAKFRPHVVHFSGHSGDQIIGFEENVDEHHDGDVVTADAFASACGARTRRRPVTPPRKKTSDQASTRLPPDLAGICGDPSGVCEPDTHDPYR